MENFSHIATGFISTARYKETVQYANELLKTYPQFSEAYEYRGIANYMLLNIDEAFADLAKAIELDGQNHKAYSNRGNIYADKQDYDKAIEDYQSALAVVPENIYYKVNLSRLYLLKKDYQRSVALADDVLNQDPLNYYALSYKAAAHCDLKKYNDAAYFYQLLVENYADNSDVYNGLGFCQIYTNELEKAKKNFLRSIKLDPDYAYPYDNLGYVCYLEKDYTEAMRLIEESIQLDLSNSWAYKNRALVYIALGKKAEAKADLLHALELGYTKHYDDDVNNILHKEFNIR